MLDSTTGQDLPLRPWHVRFLDWTRRVRLERKLAITLLVLAVSSGIATFAAMTGNLPVTADPWDILLLINLDLVLLLALGALIARRLVILWLERRRGIAGTHLHVRLVMLFSLVAVTPTIIVALFSVLLFDFGLQGWFSKRVSTAIEDSLIVAQAYLEEHRQTISADALAMAQDLNRLGAPLASNPQRFNNFVSVQAAIRSLTEAVVFDGSGRILARAGFSLLLDFNPNVPEWAKLRAQEGEVAILTAETEDRVRALVRLDGFPDTYLYVGRLVDPRVLAHMDQTRAAAQIYQELEGKRADLQISFALVFVVVALLLLLAAVWVGLAFANQLTRPIGDLIIAADRVSGGDLSARVVAREAEDEISSLGHSFNRMTSELQSQQGELLEANRQLDSRRQFIETVLSGVSSGVIGLDPEGLITLPNRRACDLLGARAEALQGQEIAAVLPEAVDLFRAASRQLRRVSETQVTRQSETGGQQTLFIRIAPELSQDRLIGFVVTIDDVSELLSAQRKAAWADVARRIAHEIKNPLTPIQLSAERLKRRYLKQIQEDPETFQLCTDTIVRQVGEIGRMVGEFSAFARMPRPQMDDHDLVQLIEESVVLQREAHPGIAVDVTLPVAPLVVRCDNHQIGQALTNLLQNALDSVEARVAEDGGDARPGRLTVELLQGDQQVSITVTDNGRGLPQQERHRLTEPYVTTREKGTGLGLAIVKKIMEDHGGDLVLADGPDGGAKVSLVLPTASRGDQPRSVEAGDDKEVKARTDLKDG